MQYPQRFRRATSFAVLAALLSVGPAAAYDWGMTGARATIVEGSYMPYRVTFQIDKSVGSCPAGTWLTWVGQGNDLGAQQANAKAVYALLLSAKLTGSTISVFGYNNGCSLQFIHLN